MLSRLIMQINLHLCSFIRNTGKLRDNLPSSVFPPACDNLSQEESQNTSPPELWPLFWPLFTYVCCWSNIFVVLELPPSLKKGGVLGQSPDQWTKNYELMTDLYSGTENGVLCVCIFSVKEVAQGQKQETNLCGCVGAFLASFNSREAGLGPCSINFQHLYGLSIKPSCLSEAHMCLELGSTYLWLSLLGTCCS